MKNVSYFIAKLKAKITRSDESYAKLFRKMGMKIGKNSHIYSNIITPESFLIEIGDNVTISSDVIFVTHDNSIIKVDPTKPNLFGKIIINDNCFVGERSTLLYGITLANNVIVATGSVVTKSFEQQNIIIGGNPAKIIGTWDSFLSKRGENALSRANVRKELERNPEKLVVK